MPPASLTSAGQLVSLQGALERDPVDGATGTLDALDLAFEIVD